MFEALGLAIPLKKIWPKDFRICSINSCYSDTLHTSIQVSHCTKINDFCKTAHRNSYILLFPFYRWKMLGTEDTVSVLWNSLSVLTFYLSSIHSYFTPFCLHVCSNCHCFEKNGILQYCQFSLFYLNSHDIWCFS